MRALKHWSLNCIKYILLFEFDLEAIEEIILKK